MYRGWESWGQNKDGGRGKFLIRQFVGGGVSVNQRLICWRIFLPKDPVCPLHLDQNPHFPTPSVLSASSWARTWIGPLRPLLCFKVIQGLQFEKQNQTQVHFGPKFCVLVFLEFHHWAALERHYASAAVIGDLCDATSHWQEDFFFSLFAQKKVIRDKSLHGALLALQKYENLALPNKILTCKLTSGSWKDFPGNLFLIMY